MYLELMAVTAGLWSQSLEPAEAALFREQYFRNEAAAARKAPRPATDQYLAQRALADAIITMSRHMTVI